MQRRVISDRALRIVNAVGICNFLSFAAAALLLGGDAVNGFEQGGQFYLAGNGRVTEVSRVVWLYSWVHTVSNVALFPLMVAGSAIQWFRRVTG